MFVNGEVLGNMSARDYFVYKKQLIPEIKKAFRELERDNDIIVIEGAGSPAEINLRENDIVNIFSESNKKVLVYLRIHCESP